MSQNNIDPNCPFCLKNKMVKVIISTDNAYLIQVLDDKRQPMKGCYFIIPIEHTESVWDLPDNWLKEMKTLRKWIPELKRKKSFNINFNEGKEAGKIIDHVHAWIVIRDGEENLPSYKKGLAALIRQLNTKE